MNKKLKLFVLLLAVLLIATQLQIVFASSEFTLKKNYNISDPYEYPVTTDSQQWSSFTTTSQMFSACEVPEDIVEKMSTEALLQTVLDYPMLITVLVQNDQAAKYDMLLEYNAAFRELITRQDAEDVIAKQYQTKSRQDLTSLSDEQIVKTGGLELIYDTVITNDMRAEAKATTSSKVTNNNVKTPNGTKVPHFENLTYSAHGTTLSMATAYNEMLKKTYPSATPISGPNPAYNCHSYAWHSSSNSNNDWINNEDVSLYWTDGSYAITSSPNNVTRVVYLDGSIPIHSAIYFNAPTKTVQSKWGAYGVFRHARGYSPYSASTTSFVDYKRT